MQGKNKKIEAIEKRIKYLKKELIAIENMRPGLLTKQYKNSKEKIGGYYQISYTYKMKSKTDYVRKIHIEKLNKEINNCKKFCKLTKEWIDLALQKSKLEIKSDDKKNIKNS